MSNNSMLTNPAVAAAVDLLNTAIVKVRQYCPNDSKLEIEEGLKGAFTRLNLGGGIITLEVLLTTYSTDIPDAIAKRLLKLQYDLKDRGADWVLACTLEGRIGAYQPIEGDFERAELLLKKYNS